MQKHATITDEMIARQRSRIGQVWSSTAPYFNNQATKDTIRHFVDGFGDTNPLFRNEEYARKTRYGRLVAPPCFLYSVYWPVGGTGMPGIHAWHSGNDWKFYKPILEGDEFTYTNTLTDVVEKDSKMAGRMVIQYGDAVYKNQRGEIVAKAKGWAVWAGRAESGAMSKYKDIKKATYTPEEMQNIIESYEREEIRGANPRYWEDVQVGDELTPVVKGPLSMRDNIAWNMGAGSPFMRAHGIFYLAQKRHPAIAMIDSRTGEMDVPELVHMEDTRAQEIGIPGGYDYGHQRITWLGHLLTNWIGDDGFLVRFFAELRRFNLIGDTTWCRGNVTKKYVENGEYLVDIECWGQNQRGEITMPGHATVALPSREAGWWPLASRLPGK